MSNHKSALITGGYRGIGFEVAKQLAEQGVHVFLTARKKSDGEQAIKKLAGKLGLVQFVFLDVKDEKSIAAAVKTVSKTTDILDILINNAAILPDQHESVLKTTPQELWNGFETNTVGPLLVTQAFLPLLLNSKNPRIINVSSGAGSLSTPQGWASAYSASKTALNAMTNQLAHALIGKVAVNSACPGWVKTEMGGPEAPRSVEEGADTLVWLALNAPQTLTGQFLRDRQPIPW